MNDLDFRNKVRQLLDQSANRIDQPTLGKLREARSKAMDHFDAHQGVPAFAWAGWSAGFGFISGKRRRLVYWVAAILLIVGVINGVAYWQQHVKENEDIDADISILTDEMPIDVYLD